MRDRSTAIKALAASAATSWFIRMIIKDGDEVMGVAYSSLVCSKGIEVSIYVEEKCRRQGVAAALGSKLLLECIGHNMTPNWDAANPESFKLAKKLGYVFTEAYDAYYYVAE